MALTESQVRALLAPPAQESRASRFALIRVEEGLKRVSMDKVKAADIGRFEGKQGLARRSRKGQVTRPNNEPRKYLQVGETEVIAYLA